MPPPDALREALATVIVDLRREWQRDLELATAQNRAVIAEGNSTILDLRRQNAELAAELRAVVAERLATVKDGAPGPQGERGDEGDAGPAGERGETGAQGIQGEVGPAGAPGADGATGAAGERGEQGIQGERGDVGAAGERGETGAVGERGETGLQGEVGPAGDRGERGETGAQGDIGAAGERGEPGDVGARGLDGAAGADGAPGVDGERGPIGEPGPRGEMGQPGAQGERGPIGAPGERGADGAPGKLPVVRAWDSRVWYLGDVVTCAGSTFQALRDTADLPGSTLPDAAWLCLARAGDDGRSLEFRGMWESATVYRHLDIVVLEGGAFLAKRDNPGPCPGDDWGLLVKRGKPGLQGPKGNPGVGIRGPTGATITALHLDSTGQVTVTMSDGTTFAEDWSAALSRMLQ